jgi:hypothetical protein
MEFGIIALAVPSGFAIFYAFRPLFHNKARK